MRMSDWSSDVCSSDRDDLAAEEIRELGELALSVMDADGARAASEGLFKLVWSRRPLWTVLLTGGAAAKLREELLLICLEIAANRTSPHASAPPADVRAEERGGGKRGVRTCRSRGAP